MLRNKYLEFEPVIVDIEVQRTVVLLYGVADTLKSEAVVSFVGLGGNRIAVLYIEAALAVIVYLDQYEILLW